MLEPNAFSPGHGACIPRETEPIEYTGTHTHTYIHTGIYYKELAHTVMEAERSHDPQLASWRPSRAYGIAPA